MTSNQPVNLDRALESFDEIYSPRIVATMNDYDVRIAKTLGDHVWHVHEDTDEFFLVLDGQFDIALREATAPRTPSSCTVVTPSLFPRAPSTSRPHLVDRSLMFEPSGTSTTGDRHEGDDSRSR